ncbi:hypothetical protein [Paenibacillus soyae]|uniref:Uncharacterized protein n=1 Tax=Paenibacillus soyae TaxID=2969249 RepID=A0A9X2MSF1_9BACL|nr:hypothetical protein [Paenibacillus soyae]MCR2805349.1 hypothetical protein [Paenibacillus soyae]
MTMESQYRRQALDTWKREREQTFEQVQPSELTPFPRHMGTQTNLTRFSALGLLLFRRRRTP